MPTSPDKRATLAHYTGIAAEATAGPRKPATKSRATPQPPAIGAPWPGQGGVYAGLVRGGPGGPDWHLIVPTDEAAQHADIAWGGYGKNEPGAISDRDGLANTLALDASPHPHAAAEWARSVRVDGHRDWYLPAWHELRLAYLNVPELFSTNDWYWSSTQYSESIAWTQFFSYGYQGYYDKKYEALARAVRRLILQSFDASKVAK